MKTTTTSAVVIGITILVILLLTAHVPYNANAESIPVPRLTANPFLDFTEDEAKSMLDLATESMESDGSDPCSPQNCHATFEHVFSVPVRLPCSTASGEVPDAAHLPLVYPGDFDQCRRVYGFAGGHYCTIDTTEFVAIPLREGITKFTGEAVVLGKLHLGKCVSTECTADLLRKSFLRGVRETARRIQRRMPLHLYIPFVEQMIINSTQVRCVDEDETTRGSIWDRPGSSSAAVLCIFLLLLVTSATAYDVIVVGDTVAAPTVLTTISVRHSLHSLLTPMSGDFLTLNGVRVVSMMWIIYGHVVLYSSGLALPFPVQNPSAIDTQVQSVYINLSRAAEFSVDTFFFMSAFLACWGTLHDESKKNTGFSFVSYVTNLVLRYMRLTPVYAFVLLFYIKLFPFTGTGPFYDAYQGIEFREQECKNWWTNLLYVNNLVPYGDLGGLRGCAGWTWYMANDMQYFLLVVPSVTIFMYLRKRGFILTAYAPSLVLLVIQLSTTLYIMNVHNIYGAFDPEFNVHLYVKPWCRVAPFAVGMAFAFWHFTRTEDETIGSSSKDWRSDAKLFYGVPPLVVASFAFAVMTVISFSTYDQFRCKADDPATDCNIYSGFTVYGALVGHNWNHNQLTAYFVLTYGAWAVCLGLVCMYFFSGRGGIVNAALSHYLLTPLARLSYSVYLVHIPVIQYLYLTSPSPLYVSRKVQVMDTIGVVAVAYVIAFILYLFVERPAMSVMLLILRRGVRAKAAVPVMTEGATTTEPLLG